MMVSPETLSQYPFFTSFSAEQIATLAHISNEIEVQAGEYLFREGDALKNLYLIVDGSISIVISVPDKSTVHSITSQLTESWSTVEVPVSSVRTGEVFSWSALIPPHTSTASAKATTHSRLIAINGEQLMERFREDGLFGYVMLRKVTQIIRDRLHDLRIRSLDLVTK